MTFGNYFANRADAVPFVDRIIDNPRTRKGWIVDHDHKTGKVRGIVCNACNSMLGQARDSAEILWKGIFYLTRHSPSDINSELICWNILESGPIKG